MSGPVWTMSHIVSYASDVVEEIIGLVGANRSHTPKVFAPWVLSSLNVLYLMFGNSSLRV